MKNTRHATRFVALLLTAALVPLGARAADEAEEILTKVKHKYDSIRDAEMKFTQHVRMAVAGVEQRVEGTLQLKKENKYRVEMRDQTIVTDGETVWSYSDVTKQVIIDRFSVNERTFSPERLLTAAPSDFEAVVLGRERLGKIPTVVLKLTPRQDNSLIRSLKIWVGENDWLIRKVEMEEIGRKLTTYTVSDLEIDPGLPDARFTFEVPEGAEIVDLR